MTIHRMSASKALGYKEQARKFRLIIAYFCYWSLFCAYTISSQISEAGGVDL